MKTSDLIRKLQNSLIEEGDQEIEFIVCASGGMIVAMNLEHQTTEMVKILKLFDPKNHPAKYKHNI